MLKVDRRTGYGNDAMMIHTASIWENVMEIEGQIYFYAEPVTEVVDVCVKEEMTTLYTYNHNTGDFIAKYNAVEEEIRTLWKRLKNMPENLHRDVFTVDLLRMAPVLPENFTQYYPTRDSDNLFIFDTELKLGGFPNIFLINKHTLTGPFSMLFRVQIISSRISAKVSFATTTAGKEFTYRLIASHLEGNFQEQVPDSKRFHLPTSNRDVVPEYYNTENMRKHSNNCGVEKILRTTSSVISTENPFGEPDANSLLKKIRQSYVDKGTVQLSDLITAGIPEVIKELPKGTSIIIPINQDVQGGFRKACLHNGEIHIFSDDADFDYATVLGASDDIFVIHENEDSYPKLLLPAPSDSERKEYIN